MSIHRSINRTRNARVILVAAVIAAGGLGSSTAWSGPVEDNHGRCMASASGSADSLERWSGHCEAIGEEFATNYHDCMRNAPGSADSLERWVDHCSDEAAATASAD